MIIDPYRYSSSFTPASISGLQFWFRSDLGITKDGSDLVATWADQSGNGRDLTEATNKPLWVDSLINGYPAIRFDGTNDRLMTADFAVSQPYHWFIVFNPVSWTDTDAIMAADNDASGGAIPRIRQSGSTPNILITANSTSSPALTTFALGTFALCSALFNGTSSTVRHNTDAASGNGNSLTGSMDGLVLGANFNANFGNAEIAEVFGYNAEITGADLTNITSYVSSRYGIF